MQKSQRLIQLLMRINAMQSFTARELADEFGLSVRTITRDLQELSEIGVPVYSVQGRGGGYRLLRDRVLPPIAFTENEALALFVACRSLERLEALPFGETAGTALRKFYHYMPKDVRERIDRLQNRVAVWSPRRPASSESLRILLQAVLSRCAATIEYRSRGGMRERDIQPIGLYASDGYWYCPAYCLNNGQYRLYRADRIVSVRLNESVPCREEVWRLDLENPPDSSGDEQATFKVELTPNGVRELESDERFGPAIERREDGGGTAAVSVPAANLSFYADWMWRLGEDARILEPAEAIDCIRGKLESMRERYGLSEGP